MNFDYEKSIWGRGSAELRATSPTAFRLRQALQATRGLKPGSKVLEFGCGAGQFIRGFKKNRPELDCYGSDISARAISEAKDFFDDVSYELTSETLPFEDGFFDAVLVFDVLEHVGDVDKVLSEIRRVLKPGGVFYSFVPCEGDYLSVWFWRRKFGCKNDLTKMYAGHINYFSRRSLKALYLKHNFHELIFKYSEHVLGQILGLLAFSLMNREAKNKGLVQINSEDYFRALGKNNKNQSVMSLLKKVVNFLVFWESVIFFWLPSPNVHVTAKK